MIDDDVAKYNILTWINGVSYRLVAYERCLWSVCWTLLSNSFQFSLLSRICYNKLHSKYRYFTKTELITCRCATFNDFKGDVSSDETRGTLDSVRLSQFCRFVKNTTNCHVFPIGGFPYSYLQIVVKIFFQKIRTNQEKGHFRIISFYKVNGDALKRKMIRYIFDH